MATKKTNKIEKSKVIDAEVMEETLLPVNPLMQSPVITPSDEAEQKVELINEVETLATLNKQVLAAKRTRIELEVDNQKLDTAKKTASTLDKIINTVADEEVLERVKGNVSKPLDLKLMAEAADKLSSTLKNLMNPSVADEFGNRKRTKIVAQFQTPSGERASIGVDISDD